MALKVRQVLKSEHYTEPIIINKNAQFDINEIDYYKKLFDKLKKDNRLLNDKFEDNTWVTCGFDMRPRLEFDIENRLEYKTALKKSKNNIDLKELNIALKCFAAIKLLSSKEPKGVREEINNIKKSIINSSFYDDNFLEDLDEWISSYKILSSLIKCQLEFISFYTKLYSDEYFHYFSTITLDKRGVRDIPNYQSSIRFDFCIKEFIKNASTEEKEKFFPVILWWEITSIIPIRATEFTLTTRNCCIYSEDEDKFYLRLMRSTHKGSGKKIKKITKYKLDEPIEVDERIYNLINEYLSLVDPNRKQKYLLSYKSQLKFMSPSQKSMSLKKKLNLDYFNIGRLNTLVCKFYREIIKDKYGFKMVKKGEIKNKEIEIEKINLMDTRHFAFCSLILQGYNPLTIARLGGHADLKSQYHYHSHLDKFVDSNTYLLSKNLTKKIENKYSYAKKVKLKSKLLFKNEDEAYRKVKKGRCFSKNFPYECINVGGDCNICDYYVDIKQNDIFLEELKSQSMKLEIEIKTQIELINNLCNQFSYKDHKSINLNNKELLKINSNKLNSLVYQKSYLDSQSAYIADNYIYKLNDAKTS